jgi:hypothetical protein
MIDQSMCMFDYILNAEGEIHNQIYPQVTTRVWNCVSDMIGEVSTQVKALTTWPILEELEKENG